MYLLALVSKKVSEYMEIFNLDGLYLGWAWVYLMKIKKVYQLRVIHQLDGCWNI
jgi:hypothetical protein